MGESLRRYARRSLGLEIRDYSSLSGFSLLTDVQASFPRACFRRRTKVSPLGLFLISFVSRTICRPSPTCTSRVRCGFLVLDNADLLLPMKYRFPVLNRPARLPALYVSPSLLVKYGAACSSPRAAETKTAPSASSPSGQKKHLSVWGATKVVADAPSGQNESSAILTGLTQNPALNGCARSFG